MLGSGQFGQEGPSAYRLPGYPAFLAALMLINDSIAWLSFAYVGLSTLLIYLVHRWYVIEGTELEGLDEVSRQKLGYKLWLEYLRSAGPVKIVTDVARGTKELVFTASQYAVDWSVRLPRSSPAADFQTKPIKGVAFFRALTYLYFPLMIAAALSILHFRRYSTGTWKLLWGIATMYWVGYALIFWGKARYRFTVEAVFCILAGLVLSAASDRALPRATLAMENTATVSLP